ncbi:MAG: hypothetical protein WA433_02775, partial [Desulfobaccales bacterium]
VSLGTARQTQDTQAHRQIPDTQGYPHLFPPRGVKTYPLCFPGLQGIAVSDRPNEPKNSNVSYYYLCRGLVKEGLWAVVSQIHYPAGGAGKNFSRGGDGLGTCEKSTNFPRHFRESCVMMESLGLACPIHRSGCTAFFSEVSPCQKAISSL